MAEYYGETVDFIDDAGSLVSAYTPEEIEAVAGRVLPGGRIATAQHLLAVAREWPVRTKQRRLERVVATAPTVREVASSLDDFK